MRGWGSAVAAPVAAWLLSMGVAAAAQNVDAPTQTTNAGTEASDAEQRWWEHDIWADPERGFHYYPPPERRKPPAQRKSGTPPSNAAARKPLEQITDIEELRAERERRLNTAVMQPTPENMRAYLEVNTLMLRKSALFSDMWRRTVWEHPEFDFNTQHPFANFAQADLRQMRSRQKAEIATGLSQSHGLLFFYKASCPYCKLQAPVLRMLSSQYGIEVLAISLDGSVMEEWPEAKPDNGISMVVSGGRGIDIVPTLYLVSRATRQAIALGSGVLALDEIIERMYLLTQTKPGEGLAGGLR